jgi:hypothetical protein
VIDRVEFEAFRVRQRRLSRVVWLGLAGGCVACFFVLGALGSYLSAVLVVVLVPFAGYGSVRRWNRACWLRRFPELADRDFRWRPDPDGGRLT